ncbi:EamA family transporter [Paenimyroides baculatum]|uniref:EamA family transporter n=1 Tax=Paenimyroides baculatum TaxID=2608000 RepID=A0A5M6CR25_9FLAO|nr:EamA family transporter [Paenimyroides baculatum]KAA5537758.1 EamA family transporter [Paenimyroides baculatum]
MSTSINLTPKHIFLALVTVFVWGTNFIAIYLGLKELPPFLFCTIRFALSALPFVFFLPRPKAPIIYILGFGLFNFALQFGLLFSGIYLGLSPGLASLVMQVQVFFSIGLAFLFFKEKPDWFKILGSLVSFAGIGIVAAHVGGDVTLVGLILTLLAALAWASGNMFTKKINAGSPLSLVVWGNLIALPFMAATSYFIDGTTAITNSLENISWIAIGAIAYVVYVSTHLGYGIWGSLIKMYPTSVVVPFTLLIPVVGFLSSALFLDEQLTDWKLWASFFIMGGLIFNLFEKKILNLINLIKPNKV